MEMNVNKALVKFLENRDNEIVIDLSEEEQYKADFLIRDQAGDYHFVYVNEYSQDDFENESIVDRKIFEKDMTQFMFNNSEYDQGAIKADMLDIIIDDNRALLRYCINANWSD